MSVTRYLAFDFGASSGRAMLGTFDGTRLDIEEVHRFSNDPVEICGRFVWDTPRLFYEMKQALLKISRMGIELNGIGIDTWGVDFGLLDKNGKLVGLPVHYRDLRNEKAEEEALKIMSREEIFSLTGLAFHSFNTIYQLYAAKLENDPALDIAESLLFTPDLMAYLLTGKQGTEYTIASTSQLLDPNTREWSKEIFDRLGLPIRLMGKIEFPGTLRGTLLPQIAKECGVGEIPVYAIGGHDTASAVAAVPAQTDSFAYLSSGTWSLLGVEIPKPLCTTDVLEADYTNEGGVDGSIRLLKNIMGLWIIQECKREWDRRSDAVGFAELVKMAEKAPAFKAIIDVDDPCFLKPGDMPNRIQEYCRRTGQEVPQGRGEISRVVYESLALKYRWAIERLELDILKKPIDVLHIVGGGSKNIMLNRMTANAINRKVITGPGEGTAIGNLLMQAVAVGEIPDVKGMRKVVAASFPTEEYLPEGDAAAWDAAYARYLEIMKK